MKTFKKFLKKKSYIKAKLTFTKTNHFQIQATINGVLGNFILDTGATNTCIGLNTSLDFHDVSLVDGIIGADLLKKSKAIIDYSTSTLYLRQKK